MTTNARPRDGATLDRDLGLSLYRTMLECRLFEQRITAAAAWATMSPP